MSALGSDGGPVRDEDLHAFVDGHLDAVRRGVVEAYLKTDAGAAARVADWADQNRRLSALFDPVLDEPVPERIAAAIARGSRRVTPARPSPACRPCCRWKRRRPSRSMSPKNGMRSKSPPPMSTT